MGVPIMYGECDGGPYRGKNLAHHEWWMLLAIDRTSPTKPTAIPGMIASNDPNITFGAYWFDEVSRRWKWHAEMAHSIRSADKSL